MIAIGKCQQCGSVVERGDLRCAVCGTAVPVDTAPREKTAVQIMRCNDCGAAVSYDSAAQAPRCGFCDSTMHVEKIEDPPEQTQHFLPFTVGPDQARSALKNWLGSLGFFRPSGLKDGARLDSIRPLWWVAWIFQAEALVSWTVDSSTGSKRASWAPHAGQDRITLEHTLVSASRGLSAKEAEAICGGYNLGQSSPQPNPMPDAIIEQFDVQRSVAREKVSAAIDEIAANFVKTQAVPGRSHRNIHTEAMLQGLITERYALPAYVMAYRYDGKLYRAVLSGQDLSFVTGTSPISLIKVLLVAGLGLGLIALIVLAVTAS